MLVSKDLASSGNIRSVWNHHLDYFGAYCWNFFPREIRHPFLRKPTSEQVSIFYCLHGSFSTDHGITSTSLWWEWRKFHHSIPTKNTTPNQWQSTFWEQKPGNKKELPTIFLSFFFFPTKDFLPTGAVPKPFPPKRAEIPHWIHHGVDGWHGGLARTPGGGSEFVTKKTLGCLELQ